jgi:tripartite-type tricarboxylate transporter receptor subunit TctC
MAEQMKNSLGQPVIIENVTGGGSTVGVGRVAHPAPDGQIRTRTKTNRNAISILAVSRRHPAVKDLVAGQIDLVMSDPTAALPQVRAGAIKAYGITTKARLLSALEVPTLHESGLPGFDVSAWHGLWAPKGTPKPDRPACARATSPTSGTLQHQRLG